MGEGAAVVDGVVGSNSEIDDYTKDSGPEVV